MQLLSIRQQGHSDGTLPKWIEALWQKNKFYSINNVQELIILFMKTDKQPPEEGNSDYSVSKHFLRGFFEYQIMNF